MFLQGCPISSGQAVIYSAIARLSLDIYKHASGSFRVNPCDILMSVVVMCPFQYDWVNDSRYANPFMPIQWQPCVCGCCYAGQFVCVLSRERMSGSEVLCLLSKCRMEGSKNRQSPKKEATPTRNHAGDVVDDVCLPQVVPWPDSRR